MICNASLRTSMKIDKCYSEVSNYSTLRNNGKVGQYTIKVHVHCRIRILLVLGYEGLILMVFQLEGGGLVLARGGLEGGRELAHDELVQGEV
jgi:hypothetical protein